MVLLVNIKRAISKSRMVKQIMMMTLINQKKNRIIIAEMSEGMKKKIGWKKTNNPNEYLKNLLYFTRSSVILSG